MATALSFNGMTVLADYPEATFTAPGWKVVYARDRAVCVILEAWARRWHDQIEPIARSHRDNWFRPRERKFKTKSGDFDLIGIHSYRPPGTTVGTGDQSNHRSGSAIDINGHLHPYEATVKGTYDDGFTQAQRDRVRAIADSARDAQGRSIGRSGLDFNRGKRDGMHLEIAPGTTGEQIAQAALGFEEEIGRSSTAPVWFRNAFGHDVARFQQFLTDAGFELGEIDGKAGDDTIKAVEAFQRKQGLTVDGRVGKDTREAAGVDGALIAGGVRLPDPGPTDGPPKGSMAPSCRLMRSRSVICRRTMCRSQSRRAHPPGPGRCARTGWRSSAGTGSGRRSRRPR